MHSNSRNSHAIFHQSSETFQKAALKVLDIKHKVTGDRIIPPRPPDNNTRGGLALSLSNSGNIGSSYSIRFDFQDEILYT
jgi:hypothetical protein